MAILISVVIKEDVFEVVHRATILQRVEVRGLMVGSNSALI